ncbi:ribonuclease HII [candidate division KSB1 bacterium]
MHSFSIEKELWKGGYRHICGIDEAGRGAIAGPVVAAAVIFRNEISLPEVDDSKKLTAKVREKLYKEITLKCDAWAIGKCEPQEIDEMNILNATMLAMKRAVDNLQIKPDFLLIDGDRMPKTPISSRTIIKGDSKSFLIAAASVIAKVSRDRYMIEMAETYPSYGFHTNKGYGTLKHIKSVNETGTSRIHRRTFLNKILYSTMSIPYTDENE